MKTKAIRGLKDEEWAEIKAMASREGVPISRFIMKMAEGAKRKDLEKRWEEILSYRLKNPKDADKVEAAIKELRKGFRLREFK